MPDLTQENSFIQVDTPLGKDVLVLASYTGREELSRPFTYKLEMVSEKETIDPTKLIGKQVTFKVQMPDDKFRFYNGHVWRLVAGRHEGWEKGRRHYWAEVVPWLKLLSLNADCRIFQDKKVPEIIEQVFKDHKFTDYKQKLMGIYPKLEFCVQWRESDFDFVSRLMEEYGIFYYFQHADKKHTLMLADHKGAHENCEENDVKFLDSFDDQLPSQITRWEHQFEMVPGKFAHTDYNFETPSTNLAAATPSKVPLKDIKNFEVFDYPGGYGTKVDGSTLAKTRIEQLEVPYDTVTGQSNCASFTPGGKFKLIEHPVKAEKNQEYVLTRVEHSAREPSLYEASAPAETSKTASEGEIPEPAYANSFCSIPSQLAFRPTRTTRRPTIQGPQSAVVVGPKGNEVFTDKYGRVKVQFPWDRKGKMDEKSSGWMRVSQDWAGKGWGGMFLPRVGQEVLVEFLDGDPNRPIITGRVYNAEQEVPYKLPDAKTVSGIKSRSSDKGDKATFNELRFEDLKDKEHIYFHAQKDFVRVVEHIDTLEVGYKSSKYDKGKLELKAEGKPGDQLIDILNNRTVTVHEGDCTLEVKQKDHKILVDKGSQFVEIKKNQVVKITENQVLKIDKDQSTKVGMTSTLDAGKSIVLKVGTNSITIDRKGVTIVGMKFSATGKTQTLLKGMETKVAGTMVQVKGGMVQVKGGIVKIN